ncbi:hypothetical protein JCM11491_003912 [Sporobolomyces phaffii]
MALHLAAHTLSDAVPSNILGVHLNASGTLFGTSTSEGWVVYRTHPLAAVTRRHVAEASLGLVVPIERTNVLVLVGGPPSPLYPPNKVVLWDDKLGLAVAELEFREDVLGVAARRDRLVVALKRRIVVYRLAAPNVYREGSYDTCDNPNGLVALASAPGSTLLAFPGRQLGQVQLVRLPPYTRDDDSVVPRPPPSDDPNAPPFPSVSIVVAHTSALSAIATTPNGSVLATTSKHGTLVRVWDPATSRLVKELRRGTDTADIFGLSFRPDGGAIAVSSDKGTVHVWDLESSSSRDDRRRSSGGGGGTESGASTPRQKQYSLLKPYLPKYFSSEWSHSQFRLPSPGLPASRLPSFSIPSSSSSSATTSTPSTVEDDKCICTWVEVELSDDDDEDEDVDRGAQDPASTSVGGPSSTPPTQSSTTRPPRSSPTANAPLGRGRGSGTGSTSSAARPKSVSSSPARTIPQHDAASSLRRQSFRSNPSAAATPFDPAPSALARPVQQPRPKRTESQLVAITQSGGWFRVSLAGDHAAAQAAKRKEKSSSSSAVEGGVMGLGRDSTTSCRLVEYKRFGTDGW